VNELDAFVLIRDTADSAAVHFMNFVAGLFAFLVASHFVAARLSLINTGILLTIFSAFSFLTGSAAVVRFRAAGVAFEQFSKLASPQTTNLAASFSNTPRVPIAVAVVLVLGYAAGVVFFFESRRASRRESE
jgi:hypothetical protein